MGFRNERIIVFCLLLVLEGVKLEDPVATTIALESTVGSIQTILFSQDVAPAIANGDSCGELLETVSIAILGENAECSLPSSNPNQLIIKYGIGSTVGDVSHTLKAGGFAGDVSGTIVRPTLPKFELSTDQTQDAYRDYEAQIELGSYVLNYQTSMVYTWTYLISPVDATKPDISASKSSFVFEYWTMSLGTYKIKVRMTDPENALYYYDQFTDEFEVKNSCVASCTTITWTFTSNPGDCEEDCLTGVDAEDIIEIETIGTTSPYTVVANYKPGSKGGNILDIKGISYLYLDSGYTSPCGGDIKFPGLTLSNDASLFELSSSNIILSGTLFTNGLTIETDYTEKWIQPTGINTCTDSTSECTISGIPECGPYLYKLQLKMVCEGAQHQIWSQVIFTSFFYSPYTTFAFSSKGAISIITFATPQTPSGVVNCLNMLSDASQQHLGISPQCLQNDSTTLVIKYGASITSVNPQLLQLNSTGFNSGVTGEFPRPNLPSFDISVDTTSTSYQDYSGTLTVNNINTNNNDDVRVVWTYNKQPFAGVKPDIREYNITTWTWDYWSIATGLYRIRIEIQDVDNYNYLYEKLTAEFEVQNICSMKCRTLTFTTTDQRGAIDTIVCPTCEDLVTGKDPSDTFESCITTATTIDFLYATGSKANTDLTLRKECFTGAGGLLERDISLPACGKISYLPSLTQETYTQNMAFNNEQKLEPIVVPTTFATETEAETDALSKRSTLTWSRISGSTDIDSMYEENNPVMTMTAGVLQGAFEIECKIAMVCDGSVWDILTYEFFYGTFVSASQVNGSILTITLTDQGITNILGGTDCPNYLDAASSLKAGALSLCHITGTIVSVKFASTGTNLGDNYPTTITLKDDGYNVAVFADADMMQLPVFALHATIPNEFTANQDFLPISISVLLTYITGTPEWTYSWLCSIQELCPESTTDVLTLTATEIAEGNEYTFATTITQINNPVFVLTEIFSFKFLIEFKTVNLTANQLVITTGGYNFNLTVLCSTIFNAEELAKLGTYVDDENCIHENGTDSITINIHRDSSLSQVSFLHVRVDNFFKEYRITIPHDLLTFTESSSGTVQIINFSEKMYPVDGSTCEDLLTADSIPFLGDGYECNLPNLRVLHIRYGNSADSSKTVKLRGEGFVGNLWEKEFSIPQLPKFTIESTGMDSPAYQDNIGTITAGGIVNPNDAEITLTWRYAVSPTPSTKPDLSLVTGATYSFNYWEMTEGNYQVRIKLAAEGTEYYYEESSPLFTILYSCSAICDLVTWTFTNDPGSSCNSDCLTGNNIEDTFVYGYATGPYRITAKFQGLSIGGQSLRLIPSKYNNLHTVECGSNLRFPSVQVVKNAPQTQLVNQPLTLSVLLDSNTLTLNSHFSLSWVQPGGSYCLDSESSCTIPEGTFADGGGPYVYKVQLKMLCQGGSPIIWDQVLFRHFLSTNHYVVDCYGSVQTITFAEEVAPATPGADACSDLLTDGTTHLGTGGTCSLTNTNTLEIRYGEVSDPLILQTLSFKSSGFSGGGISGTFYRPTLPNFQWLFDGTIDTYQDYIGILALGDIVTNYQVNMMYKWSYETAPSGSKPDLRYLTNRYDFNYWEMSPGTYRIEVEIKDPGNLIYIFKKLSSTFTVENSCSVSCDTVSWILRSDPGPCASDCVSGYGIDDTFVFATSGSSTPYTITAQYLPESRGGVDLFIKPSKYNNLHSPPCGASLAFPYIIVESDAPQVQATNQPLTIAGAIVPNGNSPAIYSTAWVQPLGTNCVDGEISCEIGVAVLSVGYGPYIFKLQLTLLCADSHIWNTFPFTQLRYGNDFAVSTLGSVQTIQFKDSIAPADKTLCSQLLIDISGLGTWADCSITTNSLIIKYGKDITAGSLTLSLNPSGFEGGSVEGSFERGILPTFDISIDETESNYGNHQARVSIGHIRSNEQSGMSYVWSYALAPSQYMPEIVGNLTSYDVKYWELTVGEYQLRISMRDLMNPYYELYKDTNSFTVLEGCSCTCRSIGIRTSAGRGKIDKSVCPKCSDLVRGAGVSDIFESCETTPTEVQMEYAVGSEGGTSLTLRSNCFTDTGGLFDLGVQMPPCGVINYLPSLTQHPYDSTMQFDTPQKLELTITPTDYATRPVSERSTLTWSRILGGADIDPMYSENNPLISIPAGTLTGHYELQAILMLNCDASLWKNITYRFDFGTFLHSPDVDGSILTLPLSDQGVVNTLGGTDCANYLDHTSATKAGTNSICSLEDSVVIIRFGSTGCVFGGTPTEISLKEDGYNVAVFAKTLMYALPTLVLLTYTPLNQAINQTTQTQDALPISINVIIAQVTGIPIWDYQWICAPQSLCPISTTSLLTLTSNTLPFGAHLSFALTLSQLNTTVFTLSQSLNFNFILKFKSIQQIANRLEISTQGHLFDLQLTCSTIFTGGELTKLGTYDDSTTCTHVNQTDYIYIYLSPDSLLPGANPLNLQLTDYFEDYPINLSQDLLTFTETISGSIQIITFSENMILTGGSECSEILTQDSIPHLGTGSVCFFPIQSILHIKYGNNANSNQIIKLNPGAFVGNLWEKEFNIPVLPIFTMQTSGLSASAYQDTIGTITAGNIINPNSADLTYSWAYLLSPSASIKPDISVVTEATYSFNYWQLTPGTYKVRLRQLDNGNSVYYYEEETIQFEVLHSCSTICNFVIWTFTYNPGSCSSNCVTGYDPLVDSLDYDTAGSSSPFTLTATYKPGSEGGNNINIVTSKYPGLSPSFILPCGGEIKFPSISQNVDSPEVQPNTEDLILSAELKENDLGLNIDYTHIWTQPTSFSDCVDGTSSCTIGSGSLVVGDGPYQFIITLRMKCQPSIIWDQVNFRQFSYSDTITASTLGSIQRVTFISEVTAKLHSTCSDLISASTIVYLGTGAECSLPTKHTLEIKYGSGTVDGFRIISLNPNGFNEAVEENFPQSNLPTFHLMSTTVNAYQDYTASITLLNIITNNQPGMLYTWSYALSPEGSTKPQLIAAKYTATFNYWKMSPGDYKIKIVMTDPNNSHFLFETESAQFTVQNSCSETCNHVIWSLTNNPGSCSSDCVTGAGSEDTFDFVTGTNPFSIKASYRPFSIGDKTLYINTVKYSGLNSGYSIGCGSSTKFPSLEVKEQAPEIQLSTEDLIISGTLIPNTKVLNTHFTETWVQAGGSCSSGSNTCTIAAGSLSVGGPYIYKLQLKLICKPAQVWYEIPFKQFGYSSTIGVSSKGSVQLVTFTSSVSAVNGDSCDKLLTSTTNLGGNGKCQLIDGNTLKIKYGETISPKAECTMEINSSGFVGGNTGEFARPVLPYFELAYKTISAHQDYTTHLSLTNVYTNSQPGMIYTWTYSTSPLISIKPDLTGVTNNITLNYWDMTHGNYVIQVIMTDSGNHNYRYVRQTNEFIVLQSCQYDCNSVTWTFTADPGSCIVNCVSGFDDNFDRFSFESEGSSPGPYKVRAIYKKGSHGGRGLSVIPSKFNGLHSVGCGENARFPSIVIDKDASGCESSKSSITLSGILNSNSLDSNDYKVEWIQPTGFSSCVEGSNSCLIPSGSLIGTGPFTFSIQLKMACDGELAAVWQELSFNSFDYSPSLTTTTLGSVQIVTFSGIVSTVKPFAYSCPDLLTSLSLTHLGIGYQCSLQDSTFIIKYGYATLPGTQSLTLKPGGLNPTCTEGSFARAIMPIFSIQLTPTSPNMYQDGQATVSALTSTLGSLQYLWTYIKFPGASGLRPDISKFIGSSYTFNYYEMSPGQYQIRIKMIDPGNRAFFYVVDSDYLTVYMSCIVNCNIVTWMFTKNPGLCNQDCLTGYGEDDKFIFGGSGGVTSPYNVTATYRTGSKGGNILYLRSEKYNNLVTVGCGGDLSFPSILLSLDAPEVQLASNPLSLSSELEKNGVSDNLFSLIWEHPTGYPCETGNPICQFDVGELPIDGGPYAYKLKLIMNCNPTISWNEVAFKEFKFSTNILVNSLGSIQRIIFSETVLPQAGDSCPELIDPQSIPYIGTGAICSLIYARIVEIKYGIQPPQITQQISLRSLGFIGTISGEFRTPPLPTFHLVLDETRNAYQDFQAKIQIGDIISNDQPNMQFSWAYSLWPDSNHPDITTTTSYTLTLNYWEMSKGDYKIKILMTDPLNSHYVREKETGVFRVEQSCSVSCNLVIWTFTNYPGSCSNDCITGFGSEDTFNFQTSGSSSPYSFSAIYQTGSYGGNNLNLISQKFNNLHMVSCGSELIFPHISIHQNSPQMLSTESLLPLSVNLEANSLVLDTDFKLNWEVPSSFTSTCELNANSCEISPGTLTQNEGPFEFKINLVLVCAPFAPWSTKAFNSFYYSPMLSSSITGSIQKVTFADIVTAASGSADCGDFLISTAYLGTDARCSLSNSLLEIKYGKDPPAGNLVILSLKPSGFNGGTVSGDFYRAPLPSFAILEDQAISGYQDSIARITVGDIINNNQPTMELSWSYSLAPDLNHPDLVAINTFELHYVDMSPGNYKICIQLTDPTNTYFSTKKETSIFTIYESCSANCNKIVWTFTNNPGACSEDCVTGIEQGNEWLFESTGIYPFTVSAILQAESFGGPSLEIIPEKYNNLQNVPCGLNVKYPTINISEDSVDIITTGAAYTLSTTLTTHSLTLNTDFKLNWVVPEKFTSTCLENSEWCIIPPNSLPGNEGPFEFKMELVLSCAPSSAWSSKSFKPFFYSSTFSSSIIGSVQKITFTGRVTGGSGSNCGNFFLSTNNLGTGAICTLANNVLEIKYGINVPDGPQTLVFKSSGFNGVSISGEFTRPNTPKFDILEDQTASKYQDFQAKIALGNLLTNDQPDIKLTWTYALSPDDYHPNIAHASNEFHLNYWLMSAGEYKIRMTLTDPENNYFGYEKDSSRFRVYESCEANCDTVKWTFSNDPGNCSIGCISGFGAHDTFLFKTEGEYPPYIISAIYQPNSLGGNNLSILPDKYNGLSSVPCGSSLKFPSILAAENAPELLSSTSSLTLSARLSTNEQKINSEFYISWEQPTSFSSCVNGELFCNIPPGALIIGGGPYAFKLLLRLSCQPAVIWNDVNFKEFQYSEGLTASTRGSIQTITFSVEVEAVGGDHQCSNLLTGISLIHLGQGAQCALTTSTTLQIKYGSNTITGTQTISLNPFGFVGGQIKGDFPRSILPTFEISTDGSMTGYQDHTATITLVNVNTNDLGAEMEYVWIYLVSTAGSNKPDLSTAKLSFNFNFWEMGAGTYRVGINMVDPHNSNFEYYKETTNLVVLESCQTNCNHVIWTFTNDPGICNTDCVTGFDITHDTFTFISTSTYPYTVTATYKPKSKGGNDLQLVSSKYNNLITVKCGADVKFPLIVPKDLDAPEIQSANLPLTLGGVLIANGLSQVTDYTENWKVEPIGYTSCLRGTSLCTIGPGELTIDGPPYQFKLQLVMNCKPTVVWSQVIFKQFYYSSTLNISTSGSIQTIYFTNSVSAVSSSKNCQDLLSVESITHLGADYECNLIDNKLSIKYGHSTLEGEAVMELLSTGLNPPIEATFLRPPLPTFSIFTIGIEGKKHQDNIATFRATSIINTGSAPLIFEWKYTKSPSVGIKPSLSDINSGEHSLNYWEMSAGVYRIGISIKDPKNSPFYYDRESEEFEVLESCEYSSCTSITWILDSNPGDCLSGCISGARTEDTFQFDSSTRMDPMDPNNQRLLYTITVSYGVGSRGGNELNLVPEKYNGLHSTKCGGDLHFPYLLIKEDAPEEQPSELKLTLSAILMQNGLDKENDITLKWVGVGGACTADKIYCSILPGVLDSTGGPYKFKLQLLLRCQSGDIWDEVQFSGFKYSSKVVAPRARISEGRQIYFTNSLITHSAEDSVNPNDKLRSNSGLSYLWECYKDKEGINRVGPHSTEVTYLIPEGTLEVGVYYIKLSVKEIVGGPAGEAYSTITLILPASGPLVQIVGNLTDNYINPYIDNSFKLQFTQDIYGTVDPTYEWGISPQVGCIATFAAYFTIPKDCLEGETEEYTLTCKVTLPSGSTNVTLDIYKGRSVSGGTLTSNFQAGTGYTTQFIFKGENFVGGAGQEMEYKFYAQQKGSSLPIPLHPTYIYNNTFTTTLPSGTLENDYQVIVSLVGRNVHKLKESVNMTIRVNPREGGYEATFVSIIIGRAVDIEEQIQSVGILAPLANQGRSRTEFEIGCPNIRCAKENGVCESKTGQCVCKSGYELPDCALSRKQMEVNREIQEILVYSVEAIMNKWGNGELEGLILTTTGISEGSIMGNTEANILLEKIEGLLINNYINYGSSDDQDIISPLFKLLSNDISGVLSEQYKLSSTILQPRIHQRVQNILTLSQQALKRIPLGISLPNYSFPNFDLLGLVNIPNQLSGTKLYTHNAPLVTLTNSLASGLHQNIILSLHYLNLKINPHITSDSHSQPISSVLHLGVNNYESGEDILVQNMQTPISIVFPLSSQREAKCVFYDLEIGDYSGVGLQKLQETATSVTCTTNHLTEFSILPLILDDDSDDNNNDIIIGSSIGAFIIILIIIMIILLICYIRLKRVLINFYIYIYIYRGGKK